MVLFKFYYSKWSCGLKKVIMVRNKKIDWFNFESRYDYSDKLFYLNSLFEFLYIYSERWIEWGD